MDPITTAIIAAIAAGTADAVFGDAYQGLKQLIKSKLGRENKVSTTIDALEAAPESKGRQLILAETVAR